MVVAAALRPLAQGGLHARPPSGSGKQPGSHAPASKPLLPLPKRLHGLGNIPLPAMLAGLAAPADGTSSGRQQQPAAAQQPAAQPQQQQQAEQPCPTQCHTTAKREARKLARQKRDFLLVTFAALLLLTCCPLGLLVSVFLVVADLCSQLVLNLLSGVPIDASSSFLLGVAVGAVGSVRRAWGRWRRASRTDGGEGVAAGTAS